MTVTDDFRRLAVRVVDDLLAAAPVSATWLGDHRFDAQFADRSVEAVGGRLRAIDDHLSELDALDDVELDVDDLVDLEILRARLLQAQFELGELRPFTWNPMEWNPGTGLYLLVARDVVSPEEREASLRGRLGQVPDLLSDARTRLDEMPTVHVETAIAQLAGTAALIDGPVRECADDPQLVDRARREVLEFSDWLAERLPESRRTPRLGARLYEAALWHGLDDGTTPDGLLRSAEAHLDVVGEQLREAAAEYLGRIADDGLVRRALDEVAASAPVTDATVLPHMVDAVAATMRFVRERDLVTVPDIEVDVIEMPEIHRGVAVAYCDAPGPMERADVPTFVAVSPTPTGWDGQQVASFYREYNGVALHNLAVHEAMPGHVLQLAHARKLARAAPARQLGHSGALIEGWAVLSEELMAGAGYRPVARDERSALALRLQQLKMQARMTINAILDVRVHTQDLDEGEALTLMVGRGFQEEAEAVGKWRRAQLTAGQLPTYFVGYQAMRGIREDLRILHGDWTDREIHDLMLAHGSPAPRHLRTLLGI